MKIIRLTLICMACALMCACRSSKETALQDLRDFTTEIQQEGFTYSMSDWQKATKQYAKINEKLRKYQYDSTEMEEIGTLQGNCVNAFTNSIGSKVTGIGSFLKGLATSISDNWNIDLKNLFGGDE